MKSLCLLFLCCLTASAQINNALIHNGIINNASSVAASGGGYTASATLFNNSPYAQTSAANFIATDNHTATISFWVNMAGGDGTAQAILWFDSGSFSQRGLCVQRDAGNHIFITGLNSGGGSILTWTSTATVTSSSGWTHIFIFVDLSNSSNYGLYVNGVLDGAVPALYNNSGVFGWNNQYCTIGGKFGGVAPLNGCLSEVWYGCGQYFTTVTAFRSAGGLPMNLGATGNTPTGTAPSFYLSNPFGTFQNDNSGTGNNFAVNSGPLSACSSHP